MERFASKVALITGSTEGIGFAAAREIVLEGGTVVINGRDPDKLSQALDRFETDGVTAVRGVRGDVTESDTIERAIALCLEEFGRLDILINNAGGGTNTRWIEDIEGWDWERTVDVNLKSVFAFCQAAVPIMREQRYGRIVNVSSVAGRHKGRLSGPQYAASKAGVHGLTRHLAWDLAEFGITVNAIAPGIVMTDRALKKWDSRSQQDRALMLSQIPLKRFARPDEIAKAIAFLASDDASYITGIALDVNGGSYMA